MGACQVTGVGRYWISLAGTCYHCVPERFDENLTTGALAGPPIAGDVAPDLSDPTLERTLCAPLTKPPGAHVTFDGAYVLEQTRTGLLVKRCGHQVPVADLAGVTLVAARPHLLLWDTEGPGGFVRGLCLPSGRRIRFVAPSHEQTVQVAELTQHHVYLDAATALDVRTSYRTSWPTCTAIKKPPPTRH